MKCPTMHIWPQYLLTFLSNVGTVIYGIHVGWLAPLIKVFTSEESPLYDGTQLTTDQLSWVGSLSGVSLLISTTLFGYLVQTVGRRLSILMTLVPSILCFILLLIPLNVYVIYLARFIAGFAGAGAFVVNPVYVNESVSDHVRGFLCGLSSFFFNLGMVLSSTLGSYLSYYVFNGLCLGLSLTIFTYYWWMPETPVFLISRGKMSEAGEALLKLRRERKSTETRTAVFQSKTAKPKSLMKCLRSAFSDHTFLYALLLIIGLLTINQCCGSAYIIMYLPDVFKECGSDLSPATATTMNSYMLMAGSIVGAILMDKVGRRGLVLTSLVTMTILMSVLVAFNYLRSDVNLGNFPWVPSATLLLYMGMYAAGLNSVCYALMSELFMPELRGVSGALACTWAAVVGFAIIKFIPFMTERFTLKPVFILFGTSCAVGWLFMYCLLIETKGIGPSEVAHRIRAKLGRARENNLEMESGSK